MSVDKLLDSTQLDSDLTSVANSIRSKTEKSEKLEFPIGFVSEIESIDQRKYRTYGSFIFTTEDQSECVISNLPFEPKFICIRSYDAQSSTIEETDSNRYVTLFIIDNMTDFNVKRFYAFKLWNTKLLTPAAGNVAGTSGSLNGITFTNNSVTISLSVIGTSYKFKKDCNYHYVILG